MQAADHHAVHNAPARWLTRCCLCAASGKRLLPKKPLRSELDAIAAMFLLLLQLRANNSSRRAPQYGRVQAF